VCASALQHAPANVVGPHSWEEVLGEALALTSSQQAQLSHQLAAMQPDAAVNANAGNGAVRLVPSLAYMVHGELGKAQAMVSDACKLLAARVSAGGCGRVARGPLRACTPASVAQRVQHDARCCVWLPARGWLVLS
jgi:hypothetical protein